MPTSQIPTLQQCLLSCMRQKHKQWCGVKKVQRRQFRVPAVQSHCRDMIRHSVKSPHKEGIKSKHNLPMTTSFPHLQGSPRNHNSSHLNLSSQTSMHELIGEESEQDHKQGNELLFQSSGVDIEWNMTSDCSTPLNFVSSYPEARLLSGEFDANVGGRACPHGSLGYTG